MRRYAVALALVGMMSEASANPFELPTLRGTNSFVSQSQTYHPRWEGIYGGVHWGYNSAGMNFANSASEIIAYLLRNTTENEELQVSSWTVLDKQRTSNTLLGGFIGYNFQWESIVLGIEAYYSRGKLNAISTDTMARFQDVDSIRYSVSLTAGASISIADLGGVRTRIGYANGWFLPYATFGVAIGRGDISRFVTITETETDITDPLNPIPLGGLGTITRAEDERNRWFYGYSAGLGMDIMLMQNLFVRGEWEYMQFPSVSGIGITINSAKVGAGIKF